MTATATPERTSAGRDGFARLLHAEWTKFRTVRGWIIAMVTAALATILLGIYAGSAGQNLCGKGDPNGPAAVCRPYVPAGPDGEAVNDSFYFVHQALPGNGRLTVRVTSLTGTVASNNVNGPVRAGLEPWSKAGIIVAAGSRPGAAYAAVMVTGGHGVRMQYDYTRDTAGPPGAAASARWLRLVRSGDTLTGYASADGTHWTRLGTARLAGLPSTVQAGLFVTSPQDVTATDSFPTLATALFDHVSLSGPGARGGWSGEEIGAATVYRPLPGRFRPAGHGFTVSGSGDIAPAGPGPAGIGEPAEHSLAGVFAALIAVTVAATMFMTAEYRRGLIRITLAASPRRGQVLAAKAIVIGSVTFVTGLAGAAVAVPLGGRLLRENGKYVFPVGVLTEVRMVAGAAALLAMAAVLALALGAILRHSAGPVTAVIALIVLPYFFASPLAVLPAGAGDWLLRLTPAAGFAIQQTIPQYPQVSNAYTPMYGYFPLAPWAGFGVLCAWTALALVLALVLLRRRDA
jgi:ABC-type transport system involved in multi-copper enzyme maturation permease subunit